MEKNIILSFLFISTTNAANYQIFQTDSISSRDKKYGSYFPIDDEIINFKVKTTNDAYVALTTEPHESNPMFEILIAAFRNQYSYIRKNGVKKESGEVVVKTNGLVKSNEFRGFWIELDYTFDNKGKRQLKIKIGSEGQINPFMTRQENSPFTINYFGLGGYHAYAYWKFKDVTEITPQTVLRHQIFAATKHKGVRLPDYTGPYPIQYGIIQFRVQAGHDACVALTSLQTVVFEVVPLIEVCFGSSGNSKTEIKRNGTIVASASTSGILSSYEYRGFWIKLHYTYTDPARSRGILFVQVSHEFDGKDKKNIVTWEDHKPFPVNYFHIATTNTGDYGYWILEDIPMATEGQQTLDKFTTWGDNKYHLMPITNNRFTFQIKAKEGIVALTMKSHNIDPCIEIILGSWDNERHAIMRDGTTQVIYDEKNMLGENDYRKFWIQYDYISQPKSDPSDKPWLFVQVGRGSETKPFMNWTDPDPFAINFVGFTTAHGKIGKWMIDVNMPEDKVFTEKAFTKGDSVYQFYPTATNMVLFKVLATGDASIAISKNPDKRDLHMEIVLGGSKNKKNFIKTNGDIKVNLDGTVLHPTKFRSFWVKWDEIRDSNGVFVLIVKIGRKNEDKPFMFYKNEMPFPVNFFGISTSNKENGSWIISHLKNTETNTVGYVREDDCIALVMNVTDDGDFGENTLDISTQKIEVIDDGNSASEYEECLKEPINYDCIPPAPVSIPVYVRYLFNKELQKCESVRWSSEDQCGYRPPNVFKYREDCKRTCMYPRDEFPELIYPDVAELLVSDSVN